MNLESHGVTAEHTRAIFRVEAIDRWGRMSSMLKGEGRSGSGYHLDALNET